MPAKINVSDVRYRQSGDGPFNIAPGREDYACFAIWEGGREKENEILTDLKKHFEIIGNFLVYWSEDHYNRNIARLYESNSQKVAFSTYSNKIGKPPFRFILVRDKNPQYTWLKSVSGAIEPSNEMMVRKKYEYRDWFARKFQVHSSNNLGEFILHAVLILGCDMLERCMNGGINEEVTLRKDLEGAAGWKDWPSLFRVLNYCSDYLVLRNFESLPQKLDDSDIDILCDNVNRFAAAANIAQETGKPYKGTATVTGQDIRADMRFVGDGYYPALWQKDMLSRKAMGNGFYIPRQDDYFFSLLYHCKIHKKQVKPKYKTILAAMARDMRFDWFDEKSLDDETAADILAGYMNASFYFYEPPVDSGVGRNAKIIAALPRIENFGKKDKYRKVKKLAGRVKIVIKEPRKSITRKLRKLKGRPG